MTTSEVHSGQTSIPLREPVAIKVTRYICPFCSRGRSKRTATAEHIERCWKNPAVKSCLTCVHLDRGDAGEPCFPGRQCSCNDAYTDCGEGIDLGNGDPTLFPQTGCPMWAAIGGAAR